MKIPTTQECMKLLDEFEVPENVRQHSFAVHKVSMILAKELKKAGEDINLDLANATSLLHDIDKAKIPDDLYKHGGLGCGWLSEKGYKEVGETVKKHLVHCLLEDENLSWEIKFLIYADQRCVDDKIVSLKERHKYLDIKYPGYMTKELKEKIFEVEKEIFDKIGMKPEDLNKQND